MFTNKWIFFAFGALFGILFVWEQHLLTKVVLILLTIRMFFEKRLCFTVYVMTVIFFAGIAVFHSKLHTTYFDEGPISTQIIFHSVPMINGDRFQGIVTSEKEKFLLRYSISTEQEKKLLENVSLIGYLCFVQGELISPPTNTNENGFNYKRFLYRQNIHWILKVNQFSLEDCSPSKNLYHQILSFREKGIKTVQSKFPDGVIPYANALIFGDRSQLQEEVYEAYQRLGVVHLLAISGLHVGLVISFLYYLLLRMGVKREKIFWLLLIILPIYAIVSGGNPPVIRACIMSLLLLCFNKWRLPLTSLDSLSICFLLFVLVDPHIIYHVGFQLSFIVTLAIIMSVKQWKENTSYIHQLFEISLISSVSSLPILAYHFYEFSIISIFTNLLYIPFYSFIVLPSIFILGFLSLFTDKYFGWLLEKVIIFSENITTILSSYDIVFLTGKPNLISMFFISIGSLLYFLLYEKKKKYWLALLPLIFVLFFHFLFTQFSPKGEVIFIDVGQGDAILIKLPYHRGVYLIDTGGQLPYETDEWKKRENPFQVGKDILIPLFKSKGIRQIDKLILTHSDYDHIGGAFDLIGKMTIRELIISPNSWHVPHMKELVQLAHSHGIPVKEVKAGEGWENQSGVFYFLYPFDNKYEGNNDSLVLFAIFGGYRWLFTGDLEKEGELALIDYYKNMEIDVLKVGHHGSQTSTSQELLDIIQPTYGIISVGKKNRFGHPHDEVINRLQSKRVIIFRTDLHGGIHYKFGKESGTFRTILE